MRAMLERRLSVAADALTMPKVSLPRAQHMRYSNDQLLFMTADAEKRHAIEGSTAVSIRLRHGGEGTCHARAPPVVFMHQRRTMPLHNVVTGATHMISVDSDRAYVTRSNSLYSIELIARGRSSQHARHVVTCRYMSLQVSRARPTQRRRLRRGEAAQKLRISCSRVEAAWPMLPA
jgi:hypothetical protein